MQNKDLSILQVFVLLTATNYVYLTFKDWHWFYRYDEDFTLNLIQQDPGPTTAAP